jgi:adenylosuccinate synthase
MQGVVDIVLDAAYGSSGKGKLSTWLAAHNSYAAISSANFPNAGHTAVIGDRKFIAKALPTSAILQQPTPLFITPGSGFTWAQLIKEWRECGWPTVFIHERACVLTEEHAARERAGADSTAHIASTMQGTAAAMTDKILRRQNAPLAKNEYPTEAQFRSFKECDDFVDTVFVVSSDIFRNMVDRSLSEGNILHEGSQGYALSIDHGSHYPQCTSRNCTSSAAMDYLGVAPQRIGDVWLNLRSYPIRVGSIEQGYSGDFYSDSTELSWAEVASRAGMPAGEAEKLAERERTTVTKRVRRVATFSYKNLKDAVRTNGATRLCMNFIQYINWQDAGLRKFDQLSTKSRAFIESVEDAAGLPVTLIGTGADHDDMIVRDV